jgi:hypothetical protein
LLLYEYITPKEAGLIWGISERRVQVLCADGKVDGAQRLGDKAWMIPKTASKPVDGRAKNGRKPKNNTD